MVSGLAHAFFHYRCEGCGQEYHCLDTHGPPEAVGVHMWGIGLNEPHVEEELQLGVELRGGMEVEETVRIEVEEDGVKSAVEVVKLEVEAE